MTKNENVPELRFPGFEGQWLVHQLSQACNMKAGKFVQASEIHNEKESGMYPCFGGNGLRGYTRSKTHEGIYPLIGRQGALCGNVQLANGQFHATEHAVVVEASEQNDALWLYYLLDTLKLNRYATGQAQPGLSVDVIEKIKAYFPSLSEQQKIADFLSAVDKKIEQLNEKHRLLTEYKKGVMQQIFSQQIRFKDDEGNEYPEWEEKQLGELAHITTGSSNREDSGLDGEFTFFDRSEDIRTSDRYLFDGEAVIVAGEGQDFIPKYFVGKFDLHQRTYAIMDFNNAIGTYLFYALRFYKNWFLSQAVGSTVKSLRLPMFKKMPILLPCIEEQQKIADFLNAIDNKIDQAWSKLEQTKAFKKGLLQKMFV